MDSSLGSSLTGLITTLGHGEFAPRLMDVLRTTTGADLVSAFEFSRSDEPTYLLASGCSVQEARFSQTAGLRYAGGYWRFDRALGHALAGSSRAQCEILRQRSRDIPDPEYRDYCYDSHSVIERVSIFHWSGKKRIMLNLYRYATTGPFGSPGERRIEESGEVLGALVAKHAEMTDVARPSRFQSNVLLVGKVLLEACPFLSTQEVEVCASLLSGLSYKEIALRLGLMPSSVVTYRKRAYAKFGIMSRGELETIYERALRQAHMAAASRALAAG